jgi:hypothetical protein
MSCIQQHCRQELQMPNDLVPEIQSLNLDDLDVTELEQRLELAPTCATAAVWDGCGGCDDFEVKCQQLGK